MTREFILDMIKNISSSYAGIDTHKSFSEDLYALASNPDVDLVYLKTKLQQLCMNEDIPQSTVEMINNLNNGINVLIQKEADDKKLLDSTVELDIVDRVDKKQEKIDEQVEINAEIEKRAEEEKVEEVNEEVEEINNEELDATVLENSDNTIESENTIVDEVTLTMGSNDSVENIANQLLALKAKGIVARALINGLEVYNVFENMEQFKEVYYNFQASEMIRLYNGVMQGRQLGEHTNMIIMTPEGENNLRTVRIGNSDGEVFNNNTAVTLNFTDGHDFDLYVMPALISVFTNECSDIKEVDDEMNITRGVSLADSDRKENPDSRYRYFATMTNENKIMLNMSAKSVDQAKIYINQSTKVITDEYLKGDNQNIQQAVNNGQHLANADAKVKKLQMNLSNAAFVNGIGIGALIGLSIVGNLIGLYLLKLLG